ncbi:MAG: methyltransferase domain-containing protein [Chitinophagaceae bacterium]|nr:methyltransferase domain-containing protein [Chitinophagaceae bacterium]
MNKRENRPEQLDDLTLQGETLEGALGSLAWVNRWFGNRRYILKAIRKLCYGTKTTLTLTDLGCGGGDLMLAVATLLRKEKIPFTLTGIDGNEHTLVYAKRKCAAFPEIGFRQADILDPGFRTGPCDILFTSHFLYHFDEQGLVRFLIRQSTDIKKALVCSELDRNRFSILLFRLFGAFMPISRMARQDGELAIKRSFTLEEWKNILKKANRTHYHLERIPFFRIGLICYPTN